MEKNTETALEYYRKGYESGDPTVLEILENLVEEGTIKEEDYCRGKDFSLLYTFHISPGSMFPLFVIN